MHTTEFKIRKYGRQELAQLYSPDITPEAAWKRLKEWIDRYPGLNDRLAHLGYDPRHQRTFTPAQVEAITDSVGTP